ncbi:hypothetical protein HNV12_12900 [Methanococcoides sp. SA1]|uniref:hypothetical protein n=1 Tax=Lentimicrobium sp. L6 TaxID=2735916 RepID=UPI001553324A|nr:hypothetical protein [Lentimicrobium sp. L6]NPD84827.1 hypothetical protein [Lentimicrobium sp. L6]NPE28837.1 hypothetical protein [Methanococcoides sp. SA1]
MDKKSRIQQILTIILISIMLVNCKPVVKKKNYEIPDELSKKIWKLQSDFCTSMMKSDYDKTLDLFNDSIAANLLGSNYDSLFYGLKYGLFEYPYFSQDIFYQKSLFKNTKVEVLFEDEDFNPFLINFITRNKETAVTTALLGDDDVQYSLVTLYGKYNNGWKVDYITYGLYRIDDKDALDWLVEAEKCLSTNDYIMATYCMRMVDWLLKPAQDLWCFENEPEVLGKMKRINKKINRNLRLNKVFVNIDSKPELKDYCPVFTNKKVYPLITYQTKLSINDSISIEKECLELDSQFRDICDKMIQDSIYIRILPYTDAWVEPDTFLIKKRKLVPKVK